MPSDSDFPAVRNEKPSETGRKRKRTESKRATRRPFDKVRGLPESIGVDHEIRLAQLNGTVDIVIGIDEVGRGCLGQDITILNECPNS